MTTSSGTNSDRELDARLLRFRTQPASEDIATLATDLLTGNRAHDSLDILLAALHEDPDNPTLLVLEGRAHYASGDFLRAQTALLKAAHLAPTHKDPFRWLGEVLLKRGDPERAAKALERARALDDEDSTIAALHARAERFSRIARSDGMPDSNPLDADPDIDEEQTIVAPPSEVMRLSLYPTTRPPPPNEPEEATRVGGPPQIDEVQDTLSESIVDIALEDAPSIEPPIQEIQPPRKSRWRRLVQVSAGVVALAIGGGAGFHYYVEHHRRAPRALDEAPPETQPGDQRPPAAVLAEITRTAMDEERLEEAEEAARAALDANPSHTDFRRLLARIQLARRNGHGALETLRDSPPNDPGVLSIQGRAALLIGTEEALNQAAASLESYLESHDDADIELRALQIRLSSASTPPAPMLSAARELADHHPGDPFVHMTLGEAALRAGDANTAVEALLSVIDATPLDAEAHHLLGRAHHLRGEGEHARQSLERAVELQPDNLEFKRGLGLLLLDLGDYESAYQVCREIPDQAICLIESLMGLGHFGRAQTELESLGDLRTSPLARMTAARLALATGRSADAVSEIRAALAAAGSNAQTPLMLALQGDVLLAAGEINASAAAFENALTRDPELPEALIGRAELLIRGDHPRDASPLLERAGRALRARIRPPSVRARKLMLDGRVALLAHDLPTARARLREATALRGVPLEAFFHLGEALSGENAPEARAAYVRYLALAPNGFFANRARRAIHDP